MQTHSISQRELGNKQFPFICPSSGQRLLQNSDHQLLSQDGRYTYPLFEGIPWLLPNPSHSVMDWQVKVSQLYHALLAESDQIGQSLKKTCHKSSVVARLQSLQQGKLKFAQGLLDICSPLLQSAPAHNELLNHFSDRSPSQQTPLSYRANLYRDWIWGESENKYSLEWVLTLLGKHSASTLLVPGAGACRLSLDLHKTLSLKTTCALDINPFFLFSVKRLLSGKSFSLMELPIQPSCAEHVAVEQHFSGFETSIDGFELMFANFLQSPLQAGYFDTVLTPWFIDILPNTLENTLRAINQALSEGGLWVNFGSLVFNTADAAQQYGVGEVLEIAKEFGFTLLRKEQRELPYLQSPLESSYRQEKLWGWAMQKTHSVDPPQLSQVWPEWVIDASKPVPRHQAFVDSTVEHKMAAELFNMANNKLSLKKMSKRFSKLYGLPPEQALAVVTQFYCKRIHELNSRQYDC